MKDDPSTDATWGFEEWQCVALNDWKKYPVANWLDRMNFEPYYFHKYVSLYMRALCTQVRILRPTIRAVRAQLDYLQGSDWLDLHHSIEFYAPQAADPDLKMHAVAIAAITSVPARVKLCRYYHLKLNNDRLDGHERMEIVAKRSEWLATLEGDYYQIEDRRPSCEKSYFHVTAQVLGEPWASY